MIKEREMKDSGIPWIGEIPMDWEIKKLKNSCSLFGRIGFRGYTSNDLVQEGEGAITLSPTNFEDIKLNLSKCSYLSWEKYYESPEIMVREGDVLLVKTASVGKCVYVDKLPQETTINPQILVLKEHKDNPKFITYIFQTPIGQTYIDITKGGSTIFTISQEKIGNYSFPFPASSEQKVIVEFLDRKCGEIDELIALQNKMIEELKAYKQSLITETVTKGLDPNVPLKDSGIEWIGEIPQHWAIRQLKKCVCFNNGQDYKRLETSKEEGFPVYGSGGIFTFSKKYLHNGEAVLFGRKGTIDKPLYVNEKFWTVDTMYYAIPHKDFFCKYIYYLANIIPYDKFSTSTALPSMTQSILGNISFGIPSLHEQQEIADFLDKKCSEIDSLIELKQQKIEELKDYKKSIIYEYVTGKKSVM